MQTDPLSHPQYVHGSPSDCSVFSRCHGVVVWFTGASLFVLVYCHPCLACSSRPCAGKWRLPCIVGVILLQFVWPGTASSSFLGGGELPGCPSHHLKSWQPLSVRSQAAIPALHLVHQSSSRSDLHFVLPSRKHVWTAVTAHRSPACVMSCAHSRDDAFGMLNPMLPSAFLCASGLLSISVSDGCEWGRGCQWVWIVLPVLTRHSKT